MKHLTFALSTILASALVTPTTLAAKPSAETLQITRALVNNVHIVERLKENNSSHLSDVRITQESQGINRYRLVFIRNCECLPSTAIVRIREDLTPTYRDGPIEYTSSIEIKN